MEVWGGESGEDRDDRGRDRETTECRRLALLFGVIAAAYLLALFAWRACA